MLNSYRMNFAALRAKALLLADDPAGQRFTNTQVIEDAINEAMLEVALDTQLIVEKLTLKLEADQHLYELHPRISAAGLRPFGFPLRVVYDTATNAAVSPLSTKVFDLAGYDWFDENAPVGWRNDIYPHGEMVFYPTPTDAGSALPALTGNVQITYVAMPTIMDDDSDYPDRLQAQYHEAVVVGAAMLLLEGGGTMDDLALSLSMEQEFEQFKAKIVGDTARGMTHYDAVRPM